MGKKIKCPEGRPQKYRQISPHFQIGSPSIGWSFWVLVQGTQKLKNACPSYSSLLKQKKGNLLFFGGINSNLCGGGPQFTDSLLIFQKSLLNCFFSFSSRNYWKLGEISMLIMTQKCKNSKTNKQNKYFFRFAKQEKCLIWHDIDVCNIFFFLLGGLTRNTYAISRYEDVPY